MIDRRSIKNIHLKKNTYNTHNEKANINDKMIAEDYSV